ncbi:response regulator transcription factor [Bacillus subtilis]|uniref:response regulator transcription factor n=1 Tax=Bacillus subtilis TaxID=1423 RepID=UPI000F538194|nr:response regulator transcription factor [Bacillus subtilis]RPJ98105.1 hypothetical protein EH11_04185 [Bacillus subtilis]RPK10639.1 hypothetical protein EH5_03477 [Bacillus subtilis]RUS03560.1 hypothetical protein EFW59_04157 [Bacillus subtilis]
MTKKVLIVDDEWKMRNLLKIYLEDYDIIEASEGEEAIKKVKTSSFDLIILDIMMPGIDGWKACKEIRQVSSTPILMLTARSELKDKVHGLEIGADDYLIKPFESEELVARVNALIRRSVLNKEESDDGNIIKYGDGYLQIDQGAHSISIEGKVLDLTPKEYKLLHTLVLNPKRVFTREVLLDILWGYDDFRDTRTIDTHIKNIRLKIRDIGSDYNPIQTVWGIGYKFKDVDQSI